MSIHFQRSNFTDWNVLIPNYILIPMAISGIASTGQRNICQKSGKYLNKKNGEKRGQTWGKNWKKRKIREEKAEIWEGSFTLPLLTDRADYAADGNRRIFLLFKPKVKVMSFLALLH